MSKAWREGEGIVMKRRFYRNSKISHNNNNNNIICNSEKNMLYDQIYTIKYVLK